MKKYRNKSDVAWITVIILSFSFLLFVYAYSLKEAYETGLFITVFAIVAICVLVLCLAALVIWLVSELRKQTLPRVTLEEKNEIEKWLTGEGFHKFVGKMEKNDDGVIIFKLDKERYPFAISGVAEIEHNNYSIKDYGPFRVVQRLDGSTKKAVYWKK